MSSPADGSPATMVQISCPTTLQDPEAFQTARWPHAAHLLSLILVNRL